MARRLRPEPVRHELLAARGRRQRRRRRGRPGLRAGRSARAAWRPPGSAPWRSCSPTRTSTTRRPPATFAGDDVPGLRARGRRGGVHRPARWNPGFANPLTPVKDLRTIADGDVLEFAGLPRSRCSTRPGTRPGIAASGTDAFVLSGDLVFAGSIGRSDFPNSSPTDMEREPAPVPRAARRAAGVAGARSRDHGGTRAGDEPVPAGARLMELAPPRGTQDLLPDRADAMLGLYDAAHRIARAVRVPLRRDADVRAHRAVRAHVRRHVRRRHEGDVHVRGQGRPLADAATGEHGVGRARLPDPRAGAAEPVQGVLRRHRSSGTAGRRRAGSASSGSSASR